MRLDNPIALEARSWLGTPFHWGAKCKHEAVDCAHLVAACVESVGLELTDDLHYGDGDNLDRLLTTLGSVAKRVVDAPEEGDILVFRSPAVFHHLGIYVGAEGFIHAYNGSGINRVTVTPLDERWLSRLFAIYRCPSALSSHTQVPQSRTQVRGAHSPEASSVDSSTNPSPSTKRKATKT